MGRQSLEFYQDGVAGEDGAQFGARLFVLADPARYRDHLVLYRTVDEYPGIDGVVHGAVALTEAQARELVNDIDEVFRAADRGQFHNTWDVEATWTDNALTGLVFPDPDVDVRVTIGIGRRRFTGLVVVGFGTSEAGTTVEMGLTYSALEEFHDELRECVSFMWG